jgi:hypothetical protein
VLNPPQRMSAERTALLMIKAMCAMPAIATLSRTIGALRFDKAPHESVRRWTRLTHMRWLLFVTASWILAVAALAQTSTLSRR